MAVLFAVAGGAAAVAFRRFVDFVRNPMPLEED
jgi:hypothetical protein